MSNRVLSPGDAIRLGELLKAISEKKCVRFISEDGTERDGELRQLVAGPNFASLPWGTDVRDAYVWITNPPVEMAVPVEHLIKMDEQGGLVYL